MVDSQNKDGITKDSTLIPKLTTVTNKRLTSSSVTVSDIINDNTSLGLSISSTLILDPPVNSGFANINTNGQYLPSDFNSSGEYDPTHSAGWEYIDQINVSVKFMINRFYIGNNYKVSSEFTTIYSTTSVTLNNNDAVVQLSYNSEKYAIGLSVNKSGTNKTTNVTYMSGFTNKYVRFTSTTDYILKGCYGNANTVYFDLSDETLDTTFSWLGLSKTVFKIFNY